MGDGLLEEKKAPRDKVIQAAVAFFVIVGVIIFFLTEVATEIEQTFHVFHHNKQQEEELKQEIKLHPGMAIAMVAVFPVTAITGIALVLPLAVYVQDHTSFQKLTPLNPLHYGQIVFRVYRAWAAGGDGKLKAKDL